MKNSYEVVSSYKILGEIKTFTNWLYTKKDAMNRVKADRYNGAIDTKVYQNGKNILWRTYK